MAHCGDEEYKAETLLLDKNLVEDYTKTILGVITKGNDRNTHRFFARMLRMRCRQLLDFFLDGNVVPPNLFHQRYEVDIDENIDWSTGLSFGQRLFIFVLDQCNDYSSHYLAPLTVRCIDFMISFFNEYHLQPDLDIVIAALWKGVITFRDCVLMRLLLRNTQNAFFYHQGVLNALQSFHTSHFPIRSLALSYIPCGKKHNPTKMGIMINALVCNREISRLQDLFLSGYYLTTKWGVLTSGGMPVDPAVAHIIHLYQRRWSFPRPLWFMHGPKLNAAARTLLQVFQFQLLYPFPAEHPTHVPLPFLPLEIFETIITFLNREDYFDFRTVKTIQSLHAEKRLHSLYAPFML